MIMKSKEAERKMCPLRTRESIATCHGKYCALWEWFDEAEETGYCGLTCPVTLTQQGPF
ncbi:MAG: hypothetical protein MR616_01255 [Pyramidobacter sp.]|uniref:hypothetical protein n=1 Tax=Pyramidobacter porci TaxID=2605789 RepID=UPI0012B22C93|nr:hypothetical protein [Pyramidobacter porci]MCI6259761.1 hypothetical protein [Pyramidobacter sp.]